MERAQPENAGGRILSTLAPWAKIPLYCWTTSENGQIFALSEVSIQSLRMIFPDATLHVTSDSSVRYPETVLSRRRLHGLTSALQGSKRSSEICGPGMRTAFRRTRRHDTGPAIDTRDARRRRRHETQQPRPWHDAGARSRNGERGHEHPPPTLAGSPSR